MDRSIDLIVPLKDIMARNSGVLSMGTMIDLLVSKTSELLTAASTFQTDKAVTHGSAIALKGLVSTGPGTADDQARPGLIADANSPRPSFTVKPLMKLPPPLVWNLLAHFEYVPDQASVVEGSRLAGHAKAGWSALLEYMAQFFDAVARAYGTDADDTPPGEALIGPNCLDMLSTLLFQYGPNAQQPEAEPPTEHSTQTSARLLEQLGRLALTLKTHEQTHHYTVDRCLRTLEGVEAPSEEQIWAAWLLLLTMQGANVNPDLLTQLVTGAPPPVDAIKLGLRKAIAEETSPQEVPHRPHHCPIENGPYLAKCTQLGHALVDSLILRGSLSVTPSFHLVSALRVRPLGWIGGGGSLEINSRLLLRDVNYLFGSSLPNTVGTQTREVLTAGRPLAKVLRLGFLMSTRDFSAFATSTSDYLARLSPNRQLLGINLQNLEEAFSFSERLPLNLIQRWLGAKGK